MRTSRVPTALAVLMLVAMSTVTLAQCPPTPLWDYQTPSASSATAAVSDDGFGLGLTFFAVGNTVYAIWNETKPDPGGHLAGSLYWACPTGSPTLSAPTPVRLTPAGDEFVFVSGSNGFLYKINASTGVSTSVDTRRVTGSTPVPVCPSDQLIAPPIVQLYALSNAAFQSNVMSSAGHAPNDDVVFVVTRNQCGDTTHNRVLAYWASDLSLPRQWTFNANTSNSDPAPFPMDYGTEAGAIDYSTNTLYFGTNRPAPVTQPTVWALNSLTGAQRWTYNAGAILNRPRVSNGTVYVASTNGTLYSLTQDFSAPFQGMPVWSIPLGAGAIERNIWVEFRSTLTNTILVTGNDKRLFRIDDASGAASVTWSTPAGSHFVGMPAYMPAGEKIYIGRDDGFVAQLNASTATSEALSSDIVAPSGTDLALDMSVAAGPIDRLLLPTGTGAVERYCIPWQQVCMPSFGEYAFSAVTSVSLSAVAWGDYDNDEDLDILLTGITGTDPPTPVSQILRNSGGANPTFTDIGAGLSGVYKSSVAWGDYDNDGDLDLLLTGETFGATPIPISKVYRNSGGANPTFSDIGAALLGARKASVAWGDYDNDGDLDILLTGSNDTDGVLAKVYRNSGGANPTFTADPAIALTAVHTSSVAWGDYDNDGDLDILLTGETGGPTPTRISRVYRNSGGASPTFSDIGAGLTGVRNSSVAWGDYDNDGDLDILLTGDTGAGSISNVYRNSGGANPTFNDIGAGLTGVQNSSVAWGDFDNDGDLDILVTGLTASFISKMYLNSGGANPTFSDMGAGLTGVYDSAVAWGDFDNDADLDILLTGNASGGVVSKLYRNTACLTNTPPAAPGGLTADGCNYPGTAILSWSPASDAQTPVDGLTYNVRVGTTPGGSEVSSAMSSLGGYRRVPRLGNVHHNETWTLRLPTGTYYWSVQAVDGAFAGSPFAPEQSFFTASGFTDVAAGLPGASESSVAWGDYDNDGDLDILLTGVGSPSRLYRNSGGTNPTFSDAAAALPGVRYSSAAWGDYDNDGDLDILLTGQGPISNVYRNNGGANPTFSEVFFGLTAVEFSSVAWGDFDNDGDLDILITGSDGSNPIAEIHHNDNGEFSGFVTVLPGVYRSSVAWGDYDNDGDLDILLTGSDGSNRISKVYRNSGGTNPTFSDIGAGLTGVEFSSVAWGDYDNDGDLDILLTGHDGTNRISKVYRNSGGTNPTFSDISAGLPGVNQSSVAWGDFDNDGDLDILLTGSNTSKVYRNNGGTDPTFSDIAAGLTGLTNTSAAWGDYDNDGDLDVLLTGRDVSFPVSKLYRNSACATNTPPSAPGGLSADVCSSPGNVILSWSPASDVQTPVDGLTYNLRLGTTPGGNEISSAMASSAGFRRVARFGNADHNETWRIRLVGLRAYYWSVQAVDGAFAGSPFAPEQSFILPGTVVVPQVLPGVNRSSVAWGDYDSDGDLDILLAGDAGGAPFVSRVYRNSGGPVPTFSDIGAGLTGVQSSSVAWGDYDNDGDLDILLTGDTGAGFISRIYQNSGGVNPTFSDIGAGLTGVSLCSAAWGDYDNDGDLDILLTGDTGAGSVARVYQNSGGANPAFSDIGAGLSGVDRSSVAWGDYDNDGHLDILLTGETGGEFSMLVSRVYRNSGGANPTFSDIGAGLPGVYRSSAAWGDYDNDGDLDILLTGNSGGGPFGSPISRVYRNSGGPVPTFSDIGSWGVGVGFSSAAWGDYDNDGDLDILLTGQIEISGLTTSRVYRNSGGANPTFSSIGGPLLTGVRNSSAAWGDCDNDGDLDILITGDILASPDFTYVYRNFACVPNTPPSAPSGLTTTTGPSGTTFSWNAASDAQTPAAGLTYNLRVGTTPGGNEIASAMAAADGYRKVVRLGNTNHRLTWTLDLPPVSYYWSVQAVDGAFAGSPFATEQQPVDAPAPEPTPAAFALRGNQPNPFSGTTWIGLDLPHEAVVRVQVYDVSGRSVRTLADRRLLPAGRHAIEWDGRGLRGEHVPAGVYFCLMETNGFRSARRMVVAR